jgi:hypothetical protein
MSHRTEPVLGATLLSLAVLLRSGAPHAEPAPPAAEPEASPPASEEDASTSRAREEFMLGSQFARLNQWRDALAAFERSADLKPHVVTTYNIGYIERALGHLTRARKFLELSLVPEAGKDPLPEDLATLARSYLIEIGQKLARVPVTTNRDGISITVDGRALEARPNEPRPTFVAGTAAIGVHSEPLGVREFDLVADPGSHVIVLSVAGARDTVVTPTFGEGSAAKLPLDAAVAQLAPETPASPPPPAPAEDTAKPGAGGGIPTLAWVAFGVGAAGIVGGSVFGILAMNQDAKLSKECPGGHPTCPESAQKDIDRLHLYGTVADVSWGVAAAGAITGTVLWLTAGSDAPPPARTGFRIEPLTTASTFGVRVLGEL